MPEDMSSSWKYLSSAGSRISSLKGYIANRESGSWRSGRATPNGHDAPHPERPGWRAWAGQKIRERRKGTRGSGNENTEMVNVFPGWAVRRYAAGNGTQVPRPFELEVFISGYAISCRSPENASRSQRAFLRLAKGFASLPKLVDNASDVPSSTSSVGHLTPSTEALLAQVKLPPRPTEITEDYDIDALERQLRLAKDTGDQTNDDASSIYSSGSSSRSSTSDLPASNTVRQLAPGSPAGLPPSEVNSPSTTELIRRLHANLEKRLEPFWSSVLPNRTVRLHLFASPHQDRPQTSSNTEDNDSDLLLDPENRPLASQDVLTAADGSFQVKFKVNWEELCHHPRALHIAFGEAIQEHELLVVAQLLPQVAFPPPSFYPEGERAPSPAPLTSLARIPITHSPIRVVSDIDDTVKFSGILSGARAVFHNVFVKDLRDNVIPGMGDWYTGMWSRGVRFHYVSNGPFELLPILSEFFEVSQLPPGSIKLRSYAGRSLFNGLLSAPAARKRAGVVDVLDSFPESRFLLIGDTGEQDMELYADLARERPDRILGVFVRDADALTFGGPEPLDDPTGWKAIGAAGTRPTGQPLVPRSETGMTTASNDTSYSDYNFGLEDPPPDYDINKTIRPNAYSLDSANPPHFGSNSAASHSSLDDKALARARDQAYFGTGTLSYEPEPLQSQADVSATPTPHSYARMGPSIVVDEPKSAGGVRARLHAKFITQPPQPTVPPSINSGINLGRSSASFRSQNTDSSASSEAGGSGKKVSENEKKKNDLQLRVWRARTQMPSHIPLRVFRDPTECVESQEILGRER